MRGLQSRHDLTRHPLHLRARQIATRRRHEDRWPDMIEAALKISPDFTADIGPAFAEGETFAEIRPGLRIDHALEQGKSIGTSLEGIDGMLAKELQRHVSRRTHLLNRMTP